MDARLSFAHRRISGVTLQKTLNLLQQFKLDRPALGRLCEEYHAPFLTYSPERNARIMRN